MQSHLFGLTLLATAAVAQGTIVSPVGAATVEGSGSNAFPWTTNTPRRYLQIHSDLGTTPLVITMLSFRITETATFLSGTNIHDVELFMGEGRHALQPSYVFDNNYIGGKQLMIPRTLVTFGPQGLGVSPGPNPFTSAMDLVLPAPFVYTGVNSLIWEVTSFGMTVGATGAFAAPDAEQGVVNPATSVVTGTGCVATGQTAAMTHTLSCVDIAGTLVLNSTVAAGPANALCFLAVGFTNPNLAFPGLCSRVYTDAIFSQVMGVTDGAGAITTNTPARATLIVPNGINGVTITTQVLAIDLARADPIPFCASNGRSVVVPTSNPTRVDLATRIFNNTGGTAATEGIYFNTTVGYSLVTRFSHL